MKKTIYECKDCASNCECITDKVPTVCIKGIFKVNWQPIITAPAPKPLSSAILPKLTVAVFDREDCPEWAKYAATNLHGCSFFSSVFPTPTDWSWIREGGRIQAIPGNFDSTDWQNSLIHRPEKKKLPDWCKVGALVFNESQGRFASISAIGERIQLLDLTEQKGYMDDVDCLTPARVRPWTFEEAPLCFRTAHDIFTLRYNSRKSNWFYVSSKNGNEHSLTKVAKEKTQLDGSPCGVLEVAEVSK